MSKLNAKGANFVESQQEVSWKSVSRRGGGDEGGGCKPLSFEFKSGHQINKKILHSTRDNKYKEIIIYLLNAEDKIFLKLHHWQTRKDEGDNC